MYKREQEEQNAIRKAKEANLPLDRIKNIEIS